MTEPLYVGEYPIDMTPREAAEALAKFERHAHGHPSDRLTRACERVTDEAIRDMLAALVEAAQERFGTLARPVEGGSSHE